MTVTIPDMAVRIIRITACRRTGGRVYTEGIRVMADQEVMAGTQGLRGRVAVPE